MSYTVDLSTIPTTELAAPAVGVVVLDQQGYGPPGPPGPQGDAGGGVAAGGGIDELLAKNSAADYDTKWVASIAQSQVTGLTAALAGKATDTAVVHLAGAETIAGDKTFTGVTRINQIGVNTAPLVNSILAVGGIPSGTAGTQVGTDTAITSNGSPTNLFGLQISATVGAGQTVTTAQGFRLNAIAKGSGATVANAYGFIAPPQTAGTNNYSGVFGTSSTATLWLSYEADNTTANAGIHFGQARDTNLYRSAANVLKTDDKLITALGLGVGNAVAATTPGAVVRKMEVFDAAGASLGFVPIYSTIT